MHGFEIPRPPQNTQWYISVNTDMAPPFDIWEPGKEKLIDNQHEILVGPRSVTILIAK